MAPNRRRGRPAAAAVAAVPPVAAVGRPRFAATRARVARGARVAQSPPRDPSSPRGPGGSSRARRTSPPQAGEFVQHGYEFITPDASGSNPLVTLSIAVSVTAVFATSAPGAANQVNSLVRQVAEGVVAGAGPDRGGSQYRLNRSNPRPRQSARVTARPRCAICLRCHSRQCYLLTGRCYRCRDRGHQVRDCPRDAPVEAARSGAPQLCGFCGGSHPGPCYRQEGRCFRCGATDHLVRQCPVAAPSRVAASSEVRFEEVESSESSAAASSEPAPGISPSLTFVFLVVRCRGSPVAITGNFVR
jgi:hypothetical protein